VRTTGYNPKMLSYTYDLYIHIPQDREVCTVGRIAVSDEGNDQIQISRVVQISEPCSSKLDTNYSSSGEIQAIKSRKADNSLGMMHGRPVKKDERSLRSRSSAQVKV